MTICDRIRALREDHDMTQAQVADYLGTSAQHYGKYELGKAEITFERAIKLAELYNVSLDYIACRTNVKSIGKKPEEQTVQETHFRSLIPLGSVLSDAEKEHLKRAVKLLCGEEI